MSSLNNSNQLINKILDIYKINKNITGIAKILKYLDDYFQNNISKNNYKFELTPEIYDNYLQIISEKLYTLFGSKNEKEEKKILAYDLAQNVIDKINENDIVINNNKVDLGETIFKSKIPVGIKERGNSNNRLRKYIITKALENADPLFNMKVPSVVINKILNIYSKGEKNIDNIVKILKYLDDLFQEYIKENEIMLTNEIYKKYLDKISEQLCDLPNSNNRKNLADNLVNNVIKKILLGNIIIIGKNADAKVNLKTTILQSLFPNKILEGNEKITNSLKKVGNHKKNNKSNNYYIPTLESIITYINSLELEYYKNLTNLQSLTWVQK